MAGVWRILTCDIDEGRNRREMGQSVLNWRESLFDVALVIDQLNAKKASCYYIIV